MSQINEQTTELQEIHDTKDKQSLVRGIFNKYANLDLIPTEKEAWNKAVVEKHNKN